MLAWQAQPTKPEIPSKPSNKPFLGKIEGRSFLPNLYVVCKLSEMDVNFMTISILLLV